MKKAEREKEELPASTGYEVISDWFQKKGLQPFAFQEETWNAIHRGGSGLVNAPTGCGKTFSVFMGALIAYINANPETYNTQKNAGLHLLWITPLRALAKDIARAMEEVLMELDIPWKVGIRNGDTSTEERSRQKKQLPEVLLITPESLHLLLAMKGYPDMFRQLHTIAVDEWHELLGSKRGVQVELGLCRIIHCRNETGSERSPVSYTHLRAHET